jgi:hypothetical protein
MNKTRILTSHHAGIKYCRHEYQFPVEEDEEDDESEAGGEDGYEFWETDEVRLPFVSLRFLRCLSSNNILLRRLDTKCRWKKPEYDTISL